MSNENSRSNFTVLDENFCDTNDNFEGFRRVIAVIFLEEI